MLDKIPATWRQSRVTDGVSHIMVWIDVLVSVRHKGASVMALCDGRVLEQYDTPHKVQ